MGIHRTWASGLEPFMGPPAGRARSPRAWPPSAGGRRIFSPTRGPKPVSRDFLGSLSARPSAIFHIREPCALNTIGNIIGLAVTAGHRLLTRTREQEPMGRSRRTRTREPPRGAHSTPARAIMAGLLQTRNARTGGWVDGANARTPTPEARHEPGESGLIEAIGRPAPPPPPRRGDLSWGYASGSRDCWAGGPPDHNPPPEEGLMLTRERPLLASLGCRWLWLPSLARRALYPSHPPLPSRGGFRGLWAAQLSGKPAASHQQ
jgi:hypothetical protein